MYQPPHMQPQNSPEHTRNMILAVVISLVMIVGYSVYEMWRVGQQPPTQTEATVTGQAGTVDGAAPAAPGSAAPQLGVSIPQNLLPTEGQPLTLEGALQAGPRVSVVTPRVNASIALTGARIDRLQLPGYRQEVEDGSPAVEVLSPIGTERPYYTEFGWVSVNGLQVPDRTTVWSADRDQIAPGEPVTLSWTNEAGVTFRQVISIDTDFMFSVRQIVENGSGDPVTVLPYGLISRAGTPEVGGYYILHEGLIGVLDQTLVETDYDELQDEQKQEFTSTGGWLGITDKYWLAALVPDQGETVRASFTHRTPGGVDRYQTDYLMGERVVAPGASVETSARAFIGAKETLLLDSYRDDAGVPLFDRAVDYGWFYFLTKPIFYAIHWLAEATGNFGVAILILTLGIKLLFYPLADKSYRAMSKMKLLQPKMVELKERYGDDRQKINTELMELYKREKINPLAGCWPVLIQIPVFFSLYKVLFVTIEMRHAPFFGWIQDLSAPDPLGMLTLFGLIDWQVPGILQIVNIGIWPILMGLTMWLQMKLNPAPADPIQAKIFGFMPFIFTFMLAAFPSGLVIYWAWNNTLSIAQQWTIMKRMGVSIEGGKAATSPAATAAPTSASETEAPKDSAPKTEAQKAAARKARKKKQQG